MANMDQCEQVAQFFECPSFARSGEFGNLMHNEPEWAFRAVDVKGICWSF
jgi:hypothetical protein